MTGAEERLWAVVPVLDEAATIGAIVRRVRARCPVIVVDDASTDGSARCARAAGASAVLRSARRRGKGACLRAGFAGALQRGATRVLTLDGDGQHDPDDLPRLVEAADPGTLVLGNRLAAPDGDPVPPHRLAAIRAADWAIRRLTGVRVRDTQCGFRVYPAALLRRAPLREEGFVLETEVLLQAVRAGYRIASVPVRRVYPAGRQSRFRAVGDGVRVGWFLLRALARQRLAPVAAPTIRGRRLGERVTANGERWPG